jgi:hypothetical protein
MATFRTRTLRHTARASARMTFPASRSLFLPQGGDGVDSCRTRRRPQDPWTYTRGYSEGAGSEDDCEIGITVTP